MKEDIIALKKVIDELKLPTKVDNFSDRLKLQKAIYLLQLTKLDLGYRFSWYLRGPYSSGLTRDLFELCSSEREYKEAVHGYSFDRTIKKYLEKSKQLLSKPKGIELQDELWYELLASLHFLKHFVFLKPELGRDFDSLYEVLPGDKQERFSKDTARKGWNFLNDKGLIENKEF